MKTTCSVLIMCGASHKRTHIQRLLNTFAKDDWAVKFLGWDRFDEFPTVFHDEGVEYQFLLKGGGSGKLNMLFLVPLWVVTLLIVSIRNSLRNKPTLMYALDLDSAIAAAITSRISSVPLVYDIRDNFVLRHKWPCYISHLIVWVDKLVTHQASLIIVPDENRITEELAAVKHKILVIYNCPQDTSPSTEISEDRPFTVLVTGHLSEDRGVGLLLDAIDQLESVNAVMAGRVYEEELLVRILANPKVEYLGWISQEEAWRLGYRSDVMYSCYSPVKEINLRAASNKWFDAMMAGIPILTNQEVQKSTWVISQDIGYVFPYFDSQALCDVLSHVYLHPEESKTKGARGRQLFESEYNWGVMEHRLMLAINKINE